VATFIDDIIVRIETEDGHDELVAEVIRRLEENDLYMKLEKCKWKFREVGFLGVVIGPDRIKMKEEKVKGVLDWYQAWFTLGWKSAEMDSEMSRLVEQPWCQD